MSLPDSRAFPEWSTTETRIFRWSGIWTPAQTEAGMSTPNFRYTKRERALTRDGSPFFHLLQDDFHGCRHRDQLFSVGFGEALDQSGDLLLKEAGHAPVQALERHAGDLP